MKKLKFLVLVMIAAGFTQGLLAQGSQSFTLAQAIDYALKNNYGVKNARIDVDIARKRIWENTAYGLPQVNGNISYQNIFNVPKMNFATPYLYKDSVNEYQLGYNQMPIELGVKENITMDVTLTQLIFSSSYFIGLKTFKTLNGQSRQLLAKNETELRESVANAYYLVLTLEESKKLLDSSLINLQKTMYEISEMCKQGFVENTDTDQLYLTILNVKNTLLSVSNSAKVANQLLKFNMGMPFSQEIMLTDKLEDLMNQANINSLLSSTFDLNGNINFQILQTAEKLAQMNLKYEMSKSLPTVAGFYRHQELMDQPEFNFSYPNMIGISVDIPLFSSGQRSAKVSQRKMELEKLQISKQQAGEGLIMEASQARSDLEVAYEKYLIEKQNLELAERIYKKTLMKYKEGISSSMDLTQANNQYISTQTNYYQAIQKLLSAKNKLERLMTKN